MLFFFRFIFSIIVIIDIVGISWIDIYEPPPNPYLTRPYGYGDKGGFICFPIRLDSV